MRFAIIIDCRSYRSVSISLATYQQLSMPTEERLEQ